MPSTVADSTTRAHRQAHLGHRVTASPRRSFSASSSPWPSRRQGDAQHQIRRAWSAGPPGAGRVFQAQASLRGSQLAGRAASCQCPGLPGGTVGQDGPAGEQLADESHPCAPRPGPVRSRQPVRADVPGPHQCRGGSVAGWLTAPAGPDEVQARQAAVAELRDAVGASEAAACSTRRASPTCAGCGRRRVAAGPSPLPAWGRPVAAALVVLAGTALAGWLLGLGPWPLLLVFFAQGAFALRLRPRGRRPRGRQGPGGRITTGRPPAGGAGARRLTSPLLRGMQTGLPPSGLPACSYVGRLARLVASWR